MDPTLRHDLMCIILEEIIGLSEFRAAKVVGGLRTHKDARAYDRVDRALQRIEARCSKIDG